jgi:hypothetical protein
MIYTSLHIFLKFPGIKTSCRDFLHPGRSDPRSLTDGARGPRRLASLAGLTGSAGDQERAALGRGIGLGEESFRTGCSAWGGWGGRSGRRRAGGGVFRRRRARNLQGNGGERRRFRAPRLNWFGGEEEGGTVEVRACSEEVGEAASSGVRRQPWQRFAGYWKKTRGEGARERERKRGGPLRGVSGGLQGVVSASRAASRRWQRRRPGSLHVGASCLSEEDKGILQKSPWTLGFFGNFKNCS